MTRESLASLLPLILHFADLALSAKTPTHHGVRRTDTKIAPIVYNVRLSPNKYGEVSAK